jgi:hypothetical protein
MIVLEKEVKQEMKPAENTCYEMFKKEIDAYMSYKWWLDKVDDKWLFKGISEIMEDEFLHARFLRGYMERNGHVLDVTDEYEQKYWKIHRELSKG